MQSSKIQLENYFVEELSFQVHSDYKIDLENLPKLTSSDLEIEVRLGRNKENSLEKMCHLTINLKDNLKKSFPYDFKLVLVGFFSMSSDCSDDEMEILTKNSAPSLLFTAGREILLLITGRARFMPLMLPTIAFLPKENTVKTNSEKVLDSKNNVEKMTKRISRKA